MTSEGLIAQALILGIIFICVYVFLVRWVFRIGKICKELESINSTLKRIAEK